MKGHGSSTERGTGRGTERGIERGFLRRTVRSTGVERDYVVHVPGRYEPATPSPAIRWAPERWPCLVVFPQGGDPADAPAGVGHNSRDRAYGEEQLPEWLLGQSL